MTREQPVAAYSAPNRHYHNLPHIEDGLAALAHIDDLSEREREFLTEADYWTPRKSRLPISTPLWRKMPWAVVAWK